MATGIQSGQELGNARFVFGEFRLNVKSLYMAQTAAEKNPDDRFRLRFEMRLPIRPPPALFSSSGSPTKAHAPPSEISTALSSSAPSGIYCEMCESADHDTLECTKFTTAESKPHAAGPEVLPPYSPGKENEGAGGKKDAGEDKWCALCEKDGHLAFDCPEEQY